MSDLNQYIDKIWKGENVDFSEIKEGKNFLRKLIEDKRALSQLLKEKGILMDEKGIKGEKLFPLTVDIINREEIPGEDRYTIGGMRLCVVYYGICPELENFVTIVLWPEESLHSRETFEKIREIVTKDKNTECIIKFLGNYRLTPPNEVHPFWTQDIVVLRKPKWMYEWQHVPYLKEIGDSIRLFKSPINYNKIFIESMTGERNVKFVNIKVCVGIVIEKTRKEIKLKLPYIKFHRKFYVAKLYHKIENIDKIIKGDKVIFMVFEEVNGHPIVYRIEKIESLQMLAHVLSYILYTRYLKLKSLKILTKSEFKEIFNKCLHLMRGYCKDLSDSSAQFFKDDLILSGYLSPFFKEIDGYIYYIPSILMDKTEIDIAAINLLLTKPVNEYTNPLFLMEELGYKYLEEFKNTQILYKKTDFVISLRSLIHNRFK